MLNDRFESFGGNSKSSIISSRWMISACSILIIAFVAMAYSHSGIMVAPAAAPIVSLQQNDGRMFVTTTCHGRMLLSCNQGAFDDEEIQELEELLYAHQ
jgi:hypothetical protein